MSAGGNGGAGSAWGDTALYAGGAAGGEGFSIELIRVNPEQLSAAAEQASTKIASAKTTFDSITKAAESTASFWLGEAGDLYRKLFSETKPEMEELFARFSEHTADLQTLAANYVNEEKEIQSFVMESLPTDVII